MLLTTFRKQRQNERREITRARAAMERCIAEGHTAEEEDPYFVGFDDEEADTPPAT